MKMPIQQKQFERFGILIFRKILKIFDNRRFGYV